MCGIVGFIGKRQAAPILIEGLSKLEYRGYDSAGIAICNEENGIDVVKSKGHLKVLIEKTNNGKALKGCCGIGHTRWATHGEPSEENAHPHVSDDMNIVAVHNGIIENYLEIKHELTLNGYSFYSQTDTEVVVKLIDYYYKKHRLDPINIIAKVMSRIRGSYALAIMCKDYPGEIFASRKDSPLIIGIKNGEAYLASDVPAILKYTRNVYYIGNMELARISADNVVFYNINSEVIEKNFVEIKWDPEAAEKNGYAHFMLKEIYEQPMAILNTMTSVIKNGVINFSDIGLCNDEIKSVGRIIIVACGSSYHVGVVAQYVIEDLARIPVRVELASEFRYRHPILHKDDFVVFISQSGETADTLAALRIVRENGIKTLAVVNVLGSSIAREADNVLYTHAGPEIAVATTKAYSTQLIVSYMLAIQFAKVREEIDNEKYISLIKEMQTLPEKINSILNDKERIQCLALKIASTKDMFFIGRGIDYAICLEASLKLKEISYIHSEAYAAGELKHGTISLIENKTFVMGMLTEAELYEKTISNMIEVKSRGAYLIGLTTYGHFNIENIVDFAIYVPPTDSYFVPSLAVIPLQLMAYYASLAKGCDPDKPRNLAKSVTVE